MYQGTTFRCSCYTFLVISSNFEGVVRVRVRFRVRSFTSSGSSSGSGSGSGSGSSGVRISVRVLGYVRVDRVSRAPPS